MTNQPDRPVLDRMLSAVKTTPITSQLVDQRLEHRVTDEAIAAGHGSRRYLAVCGQVFVAAPLAAPPGRPCPVCATMLVQANRPAVMPQRRQGLLRRLLADVVQLAGRAAVFPAQWEALAEQAVDHESVRAALLAARQDAS